MRFEVAFPSLLAGVSILFSLSVLSSCQYGEKDPTNDFVWESSPGSPGSVQSKESNLGVVEWPEIKHYTSDGKKGKTVFNELFQLSVKDSQKIPLIFPFGEFPEKLMTRDLKFESRDSSLDEIMEVICGLNFVNIYYVPDWRIIIFYDIALEIVTSSSLPVSPKLLDQLNAFVEEKGLSGRVVDVSDAPPFYGLPADLKEVDGKVIYSPENVVITRHNYDILDQMMLFDSRNTRLLLVGHKKSVVKFTLNFLVERGVFNKGDIKGDIKERGQIRQIKPKSNKNGMIIID